MQIRYETTKKPMHPTNNGSSPEWFPWPRSSSKIIDRRRGFDKIIQIHRRHGFGEIIQKIKIQSATWFRRKTEEGSDAGNTDCGNRVDSKQRSVTA